MKTASLPQSIEVLERFGDLTTKRMAELLSSGLLCDMAELAEDDRVKSVDRQELRYFLGLDWLEFVILMDYDIPFKKRIADAKRSVYQKVWHCADKSMEFPNQTLSSGKRKLIVNLIRFMGYFPFSEVHGKLKKRGLRPLTIEELIEFNCAFPSVDDTVFALGTVLVFTENSSEWYAYSEKSLDTKSGVKPESAPLDLNIAGVGRESIFGHWFACTPIDTN